MSPTKKLQNYFNTISRQYKQPQPNPSPRNPTINIVLERCHTMLPYLFVSRHTARIRTRKDSRCFGDSMLRRRCFDVVVWMYSTNSYSQSFPLYLTAGVQLYSQRLPHTFAIRGDMFQYHLSAFKCHASYIYPPTGSHMANPPECKNKSPPRALSYEIFLQREFT